MEVKAIVGIVKNAGKTTTLNYLLKNDSRRVAVTSIGRDGETVDQLYGTSKPRIYLKEGSILATATGCLGNCDSSYEVIKTTAYSTTFGNVAIVKLLSDGYVDVAGPSKSSDLELLIEDIKILDMDCLYVDGALNRKTFASVKSLSNVVLVSGAAFSSDVNKTVMETKLFYDLYSLPQTTLSVDSSCDIQFYGNDNIVLKKNILNKLDETFNEYYTEDVEFVYINGAITQESLLRIIKRVRNKDFRLVVQDANKLFINSKTMQLINKSNFKIEVVNKIEVDLLTFNPFGLGYRYDEAEYEKLIRANISGVKIMNVGCCDE